MRILALDPGDETGWATADFVDGELKDIEYGYHLAETVAAKVIIEPMLVQGERYDIIVYETWRLRRDKALELSGSNLLGPQVVGVARMAAPAVTNKRLIIHGQSPAIKTAIDKWRGGTDYLPTDAQGKEHARDALRHLWYYYETRLNEEGPYYGA